MPAEQRGSVVKRGARWQARWYDEHGTRRSRSGFPTKSEARAWLDAKVDSVAKLRRGELVAETDIPTTGEFIDAFLATHEVDPATTEKLKYEMVRAKRAFGDIRIDAIRPIELQSWRGTLPPRTRHQLFRSFKQVLEQAVTLGLIEQNPASRIKNRRVRLDEDREIRPFESWADVEAIADELHPRYQPVPLVLVGTGLRPEELWGLERRHLDRKNAVLSIEQVFSGGTLKPCKKSDRQRRRVQLRGKVIDALDAMPTRLDTHVLFPGHDGRHVKHDTFRLRHWVPALRAAGVEHRGVYACRHTFATWALHGGMSLFHLSRVMGTSVAMIDATYGHLVPDSDEYLRSLLDKFDEGFGHRAGTGSVE